MDREECLMTHLFYETRFDDRKKMSTQSLKEKYLELLSICEPSSIDISTMSESDIVKLKLDNQVYIENRMRDLFQNNTSQISKESSNRKRKRVDSSKYNCHKYPCPKNLINNLLIDDCLAEIFKYVPVLERPKIALVCKKWNRVLPRSWASVKKLKFTHWRYDDYQNILQTQFPLSGGYFFTESMLYKCGRYLTELDMTANPSCMVMFIINETCPFLIKLRLRIRDMMYKFNFDNVFSHLSKLKILKIIFHDTDPDKHNPTFFNSLLNIADTLNELSLSTWDLNYPNLIPISTVFCSVIPQLKALRRFELFGFHIPESFMLYLTSAPFEFYYQNAIFGPIGINVISSSSNMYQEFLFQHEVTDDFLYNLANLNPHLVILSALSTFVTDEGIEAILKMNKLRSLQLISYNNHRVTDSSVKLLKNLEYLRLPTSNKITDDSVIKILENSPNLSTMLYIGMTGITSKFVEKAIEFANKRKSSLEIYITTTDDIRTTVDSHNSPYLKVKYMKDPRTMKFSDYPRKNIILYDD